MVAIGLVGVILIVLGQAMAAGLRSAVEARRSQQATALADAQIEALRELEYGDLALNSSDSTKPGSSTYDPDGSGPLGEETLVVAIDGQVSPHETTRTVEEKSFTVRRYVTWAQDNVNGGLKRLTVVTEWDTEGGSRDHSVSTLFTRAARGVEASKFDLRSPWGNTRSDIDDGTEDDTVIVLHRIVNHDVPDDYTLTVSWVDTPPSGTEVDLYEDSDDDGVYDDGDALLTSDGSGGWLTPTVDTEETFSFFVVATFPGDGGGASYDAELTATSNQDSTASETVTDTMIP